MRKKTLLLAALMMLCLLAGIAAAEDDTWKPENYTFLQPAPKERIFSILPAGMVATCNISDGKIEYIIDAENTDWASVLAHSYRPSSGQVYLSSGIEMPADNSIIGQRTQSYSMDMGNPEGRIVDMIKQQYAQYGLQTRGNASASYWIGRYEEDSSTYLPMERLGLPMGMATLWYDDAGNVIRGEYVAYTIAYTNTDARTVKLENVPAESITLNVPLDSNNFDAVGVADKKDGMARYQVQDAGSLLSRTVHTAIAAPSITGADTSNWTCYMRLSTQDTFSPCLMANAGEYGLSRRSALISADLSLSDDVLQSAYTLDWRDANGKSQYICQLIILTISGTPAPFPVYENWTPVPASRLNLTCINPIESGTKLTYDDEMGIAYFHITPDDLPESASYGDVLMNLEFLPPQGATAFSFVNGNTENAFKQSDALSNYCHNYMSSRFLYSSEGFTIGQRLFDPYRQQSRDLTLYKTAMMPDEFAAEFTIINWYRNINDTEPMLTEYVLRQMDDCLLQHVSTPYGSENELPDMITAPVVVIPNQNSAAQMHFIAEIYPIESENSRYYELRLVDQSGSIAHLPAKVKIILRYPEGTSFDDANIVFNLRHLNSKYQTFETFSVEKGNLHLEEDYLWFTPSSLSPFVLEWTYVDFGAEDSAAAGLPQTGDNSLPVMLLFMFGTASSTLFVLLKRRRI